MFSILFFGALGIGAITFANTRKSTSMRAVDIMKRLLKSTPRDAFALKLKDEQKQIFQFAKGHYVFRVTAHNNQQIIFSIVREDVNTLLLFCDYDKTKSVFNNRQISKKIDERLDDPLTIERFIRWIIDYEWISSKTSAPEASAQPAANDLLSSLLRTVNEQCAGNNIDIDLAQKFKKAFHSIEKAETEADNFDFELKHQLQSNVKQDLQLLLHSYLNLDKDRKVKMRDEILRGVEKIELRLLSAVEQDQAQKEKQVKKILNVIDERYESSEK